MCTRTTEKKEVAEYSCLQTEFNEFVTGKEPVTQTTDVLLTLLAAAPDALHGHQLPALYRLLGFLNSMQLVQLQMERLVPHG